VIDVIFQMTERALREGLTFDEFREKLVYFLVEEGWYGGRKDREGNIRYLNWRLEMIFRTNIMTSYSSGRYRQQKKLADLRPVWVYTAVLDRRTRPEHRLLHNKAFRSDNPFWESYYPPNGWGCRCGVYTLSDDGADKRGIEILDDIPEDIDISKFCPEEWRYNPAEQKLNPDWDKYTYLKDYILPDGESALDKIRREWESDTESD
jgi:SPP1 gp7 family putative phage head morphogenesis protein